MSNDQKKNDIINKMKNIIKDSSEKVKSDIDEIQKKKRERFKRS